MMNPRGQSIGLGLRLLVLWVPVVALVCGAVSVAPAQTTSTSTATSTSTPVSTTTTTTLAPVTTHLECYRVKDPLRLKGPLPSWLQLAGPQVSPEQCAIVGSFRLVCLPVTKTITKPIERSIGAGPFTPFTPVPLPSEEAVTQDKICYRIRCTEAAFPNPSTRFIDQFGSRMVTRTQPYVLCGPAATSLCGNGIVEPGEECDDGSSKNGKNGDCCSATCRFEPGGAACPDTDSNDCTAAQCDGAGSCNQNVFTAAGSPCPDTDGNNCTGAQCDGAGSCNQNAVFTAAGSPCPDTDGNDCTGAQCDGAGTCNQNAVFMAAGSPCTDTDQNGCTEAACDGAGTCIQDYLVRNCRPPATCNAATGQCQ